jgi:hypothetical protein
LVLPLIPRRGPIWLTGETEFETGDGEIRCVGPGNAPRLDFDRR